MIEDFIYEAFSVPGSNFISYSLSVKVVLVGRTDHSCDLSLRLRRLISWFLCKALNFLKFLDTACGNK